MEIIESREEVCLFYREHTGIDISAFGRTVREVFEGLYYHRAQLTYRQLLQKMEESGLEFSFSGLDRARFNALCGKVGPEPLYLTEKGARFWYRSQQREFTRADIAFMLSYAPEVTLGLYPNIKSCLYDR